MSELRILPLEAMGRMAADAREGADDGWPAGRSPRLADHWRPLAALEIEALEAGGNSADCWSEVLVAEPFRPEAVRNCQFHGRVRIGRLEAVALEYHELTVPVGLSNSRIIACELGDNVAVHNVRYLARYEIGDNVILLNVDEMHTSNHAKFGNGVVLQGEDESVRIRLNLINENGGRAVLPFDGMTAGDACLWARYRQDRPLMDRLAELTQRGFAGPRGRRGTVGERTVIKNCRIIKDVRIGPDAYIKGANKLKNLTVNSSPEEPSQIGEGVELVNGIIHAGCHVFYGSKAVRFVMGPSSSLKYGARLIHSYLGDNSTVSCCEVLNDLIFPGHEQHHNNSFLIAALVKGQSNIAACATIGSNHNSRAADGEIEAGRGFWPGLCVSLKHPCRFASFCLLDKGDFPAELDVPLPFALVSNDQANNRLALMPAYWWMYNMYALVRNAWKLTARDRRKQKPLQHQHVEFDPLAPDTAEEILGAIRLLEVWAAEARLRADGRAAEGLDEAELAALGRDVLTGPPEAAAGLKILARGVENSTREVVVLKAAGAYAAYRQMLHWYAMRGVLEFMAADETADLAAMQRALAGERVREWVNLGGQLMPAREIDRLRADVVSGTLDSWPAIHGRYDELWRGYPLERQRHALATLRWLLGVEELGPRDWHAALEAALALQRHVCREVHATRRKDYDSPFRRITFADEAEMLAVMGPLEDNDLIRRVQRQTREFEALVESVRRRDPLNGR